MSLRAGPIDKVDAMTLLQRLAVIVCLAVVLGSGGPGYAAPDPAKQACLADARRLCHAEMQSLSRSKVRACLILRMEQTSLPCHAFMTKARAAALSGQAADPSAR